MFGLKKIFIGLLSVWTTARLGEPSASNFERRIICVSLNNQPCQARPTLVDRDSNETLIYPFTVSVNTCGGSCNTTDDPYS